MSLAVTRFEAGRAMLMAGLRQVHPFTQASQRLPLQWGAFVQHLPVANTASDLTYGVMCGSDMAAQTFEYMSAVEVTAFDGLAAGLDRMKIPPAHYAVFTHQGPAATISQTWGAIWSDWLPSSGWVSAPSPDFERYDARFDPVTGSGIVEIWFPVVKAQA